MTSGTYSRTPEVRQKQREAALKWYSKHPGPYPRRHGPNSVIAEAIRETFRLGRTAWNKGKIWTTTDRRRFLRTAWKEIRKLVLERDKHTCQDCGKPAKGVHHLVPYRLSHSDDPFNLLTLCYRCHAKWDAVFRKHVEPTYGKEQTHIE